MKRLAAAVCALSIATSACSSRHIFTNTDPDHTNSPYSLSIGWRIVTTTDLPNYVPPAPYTYNTEFAGTLPITEVQPVITDIKFG
jgi:hypothetical protein